jgi:OmpA-OmpF porin, OOP family
MPQLHKAVDVVLRHVLNFNDNCEKLTLTNLKNRLSRKRNRVGKKKIQMKQNTIILLIAILLMHGSPIHAQNDIKIYQNYDFVPGEKIIFEDHFADDQDGEFPAHWKLLKGQAVVNKIKDKPSLLITDGNNGELQPRIKIEKYLDNEFTVEFDFIFNSVANGYGDYTSPTSIYFYYNSPSVGYEAPFLVTFGLGSITIDQLTKSYPSELLNAFENKWHHAAIIFKNGQMKTYVDQYRVCVNPDVDFKPYRLTFDGSGNETNPVIFSNIKIANGGGMYMIGKKFTDSKLVTHGINFDIEKATIKPESMGTMNSIVQLLKDNPDVKFEIGGHTDNTGTPAHNVTLSQQRSEAVKAQLLSMGIDAGRLTTKGYGDSKPISDNTTSEGKANNRRVEFTKL